MMIRTSYPIRIATVIAILIAGGVQTLFAQQPPVKPVKKESRSTSPPTTERSAEEMSIDDLPTDDELEQEERDARNLMRVEMQQASKNAAAQDRIRQSNEEAAAAQAALYKQLLESRKQEGMGANNPAMATDFSTQTVPGAPSAAGQAWVAGYTPAGRAAASSSGASSETQRAIDALAIEDGPDVARAKGLGFVPMGTIIDLRLLTSVNTAIPGPVVGQVVYDVWDVDMKYIVIPRGSKAIGMAGAMGSDTEARGRITFTMFVDPSGRNIPMAVPLIASNRIGITGVDGKVNYHWGKVFGGSLALGVLGGLLQSQNQSTGTANSTGMSTLTGTDLLRQNATQSLGNVSNSLLQRFVQIKPDIEIKEGTVAKLIVTTNIMARPYRSAWRADEYNGGAFTPQSQQPQR
jgi:type IV secretory pathway VirB10-like protein